MTYTITIQDTQNLQAKSLLSFLQSLAEKQEYSFLNIERSDIDATSDDDLKHELNMRYEHFLQYGDTYKNWDDIKSKYL